jgi:hypothetical protein
MGRGLPCPGGLRGRGRWRELGSEPSRTTRTDHRPAVPCDPEHVNRLGPEESQFGHKEIAKNAARVLGRMYEGPLALVQYLEAVHDQGEARLTCLMLLEES